MRYGRRDRSTPFRHTNEGAVEAPHESRLKDRGVAAEVVPSPPRTGGGGRPLMSCAPSCRVRAPGSFDSMRSSPAAHSSGAAHAQHHLAGLSQRGCLTGLWGRENFIYLFVYLIQIQPPSLHPHPPLSLSALFYSPQQQLLQPGRPQPVVTHLLSHSTPPLPTPSPGSHDATTVVNVTPSPWQPHRAHHPQSRSERVKSESEKRGSGNVAELQ